jgi:hypothetical protein
MPDPILPKKIVTIYTHQDRPRKTRFHSDCHGVNAGKRFSVGVRSYTCFNKTITKMMTDTEEEADSSL